VGLSVGIITFNEEKRLERTLESVKSFADEVIIVDSGSTDKTHEIAQKFSANFFVESWKGYGLQKRLRNYQKIKTGDGKKQYLNIK
jgi:glycosyltransferase involved in cell wall biosynthesis